jgi:hypothetical protein
MYGLWITQSFKKIRVFVPVLLVYPVADHLKDRAIPARLQLRVTSLEVKFKKTPELKYYWPTFAA